MTEFDYSQYDNGDDYTTVDAIYDMIHQADNTSRPMSILLECYNKYENHTSEADAIANDKEALDWLDDYWEYVCSVEHGNQGSIEEIGGFIGMAETITNPEIAGGVIDYLQYDDEIDEDAQNLIDRLRQITSRYNGVSKMKKNLPSEDEIRNNGERVGWEQDTNGVFVTYWIYDGEGYEVISFPYGPSEVHPMKERHKAKYMSSTKKVKKMKKSIGRYGQVEQVSDMSSDVRRIYEYKVKLDIDDFSGFVYIWWRVFEQDGTYRLMRLEGNAIEGLSEELRNTYFSTLDEAISCADNWTDKIKEKMMSLYGHGMDASWSDSDIESYNNFGDSIKSTKKSAPSIHDMIAQTRANNNSLVKSRVDLHKNLSSVGASYQLDYDRISNEMLDILVQSKQPNGDYDMDEYRAYEQWEKANYDIDIYDEYGDKDYDSKLLDMVEDKFIRYKKRLERELMDKVYDIQYNDLIAIAGRELYAKSTNGNDSYNGCKIWAGPDKDDDRGWYFDVSDFVRVIEPSYSGESIFGF